MTLGVIPLPVWLFVGWLLFVGFFLMVWQDLVEMRRDAEREAEHDLNPGEADLDFRVWWDDDCDDLAAKDAADRVGDQSL